MNGTDGLLPDVRREAHSVRVKRWLTAMVAGLILATAAGSGLVLLGTGPAAEATDPGTVARQFGSGAADDKERDADRGHGPPLWSYGHAKMSHHGPGKLWKVLSPGQRHDLMKRLSRAHAEGRKAFADCVQAGRSECEKPLPPGLAKRR